MPDILLGARINCWGGQGRKLGEYKQKPSAIIQERDDGGLFRPGW